MMVLVCMSICYVLFWIMVVPSCDSKGMFVKRVTESPLMSPRGGGVNRQF
jgi:hypothetical protein